jgi:four helix bundle protein
MPLKTFRGLIAWQRAMTVVETSFAVADIYRKRRRATVAYQLERSSLRVPRNISEGYGRESTVEYRRFLTIGMSSLRETETLLLVGERLHAAPPPAIELALRSCDEAGRVLYGLQRSLE